ncbi:MAG: hypothetical protein ACTTJC_08885 [Campylobacter sp.]
MKKAFALIELITTIIITAILTTIGVDIMLALYKNYTQSKAINELESKSELVLEQISKLLEIRLKESLIARDPITEDFIVPQTGYVQENFKILEWLAISYESMLATTNPDKYVGGYSGFTDLNSPKTRQISPTNVEISTPKSDLKMASQTISDLTQEMVNLHNKRAGIFFKGIAFDGSYPQNSFGFDTKTHIAKNIFTTIIANDPQDSVLSVFGEEKIDEISEQYHLIHTAYALVAEQNSNEKEFNLALKYNYQPWKKDGANDYKKAQSSLIAKNVSEFKFTKNDDTLIIKICLRSPVKFGKNDSGTVVCKNKVIY